MKVKFLLLFCVLITIQSCRRFGWCREPELGIDAEPNESNSIRLDGYYYEDIKEGEHVDVLYLYLNGVAYATGGNADEIINNESFIPSISEEQRSHHNSWGAYTIEGNQFIIQIWSSVLTGCSSPFYEYRGEIINDTTIHLSSYFQSDDIREVDIMYRFKYHVSKPDSTNDFIE